jgi:hypothetical protein
LNNNNLIVVGAEEKKESDEREELDFMFDEEMDIPAAKNNRWVTVIVVDQNPREAVTFGLISIRIRKKVRTRIRIQIQAFLLNKIFCVKS